MILSHRIGLALLDRKNQDPLVGRDTDVRSDVLGGRVGRKLDKLAKLAARLTRLGSRELPFPARLHRVDLPPAPQSADPMAWAVTTGRAPASILQAVALASLRSGHEAVAPAPARAVAAAASGTRARGPSPSVPVADQGRFQAGTAAMVALPVLAPPKRDIAKSASRLRLPVAAVETAAAARGGGHFTRSDGSGRSRAPRLSMALQAAGRAAGNGKALPSITLRPSLSSPTSWPSLRNAAMSADRSGPTRRGGMEVLHAAVPGAARRDLPVGSALPSATRELPLEVAKGGPTGDARHRLAVLQRSVVSSRRAEPRQDVLRRQVVPSAFTPGRPVASAVGGVMQGNAVSRQATDPDGVADGGLGMEAGRMMVSLMGDVVVDGRRLGQVAASSQARQASLPAHGPSRVNLRAVPIHSGMQIPQ